MRKLIPIVALSMLLIGVRTPAFAAAPAECTGNQGGATIDCYADSSTVAPTNLSTIGSSKQGTGSSQSTSAKKYVPYDRLTTGADGQACMTTGYYEEGTSPGDGVPANPSNPQPFIYANLADSYPPCPQAPRQPGEAAPVETPRMVAARFWEQVPLPKPAPSIAPGRAITGKLAYLETRGQTTHTYTNNTTFGALEIVAKGSYTIDWGDGVTTGPHAFEGKAWPDGKITHEYMDVGQYDVVVTERWTATWRVGGESGNLRTLQTIGRIDDFPVEQIQAVVQR